MLDNIYRGLTGGILISVVTLTILFYGQYFESRFFAPFNNFYGVVIENKEKLELDLYAIKNRDCRPLLETLGISQKIDGIEEGVVYEIIERDKNSTQKPTGINKFGIWTFETQSPENLKLIISHDCGNPLWNINRKYDIIIIDSYKELIEIMFNK